MKRARLTAEHFAETAVVATPISEVTAAISEWRQSVGAVPTSEIYNHLRQERRDPAYARLRELMDQKRALDNAIHAERLRLRH